MRGVGADRSRGRERPDASLSPSRDGARKMAGSRRRPAARKDEFLERRERVVERIELALESFDMLGLNQGHAGNTQLAAKIEEVMLHLREAVDDGLRQAGNGEDHADRAVRFIYGAVRLHPRIVLLHAVAIAEAGGPVVTRACIDLAQSIAHGV